MEFILYNLYSEVFTVFFFFIWRFQFFTNHFNSLIMIMIIIIIILIIIIKIIIIINVYLLSLHKILNLNIKSKHLSKTQQCYLLDLNQKQWAPKLTITFIFFRMKHNRLHHLKVILKHWDYFFVLLSQTSNLNQSNINYIHQ